METETITIEYEDRSYEFPVERQGKVDQIHIFIKEVWWSVPDDAGPHGYINALEQWAKRIEALVANGWELVASDSEHIYFEKPADQSREKNEFEVVDELE